MSSQLIGVLAASTQGDASPDSLQKGAWVAGNATQYNYLEHSDVLSFAKDMAGCGKDENCQKEKWEKQKYNDESLLNVEEAQNTYGYQRAQGKSLQIADSIDTLISVQCATSTCESYKTELLQRSVDSYAHLSDVLEFLAPSYDRLGFMAGAAAGRQGGAKLPGVPERAGLAQVQKAVDYLRSPKADVGSINHVSGVSLSKSQSKMIADFESAGYPTKPVVSPTSGKVVGTQYILPDGSRVRVMQADGRSPQRASFENHNGGPVDPTTGKPPQPPQGLSKAQRKQ